MAKRKSSGVKSFKNESEMDSFLEKQDFGEIFKNIGKIQKPKGKKNTFHFAMKCLVRFVSIAIPFLAGYWRYHDVSHTPTLFDFLYGATLSTPFSLGLFLSTTRFGVKIRRITLILVIISALPHIAFAPVYGSAATGLMILIEIYAIYILMTEKSRHNANP